MERRRFLIYPWNISMTDCWGTEGLKGLRDSDPEKVAKVIMSEDVEMDFELAYVSAMAEYLSHGYQRKAAEVTRALVKSQPLVADLVKKKI